jgi:hypothetical protein
MIPVGLLDNALTPAPHGTGAEMPILVILIGVPGGTICYGITGLFLEPHYSCHDLGVADGPDQRNQKPPIGQIHSVGTRARRPTSRPPISDSRTLSSLRLRRYACTLRCSRDPLCSVSDGDDDSHVLLAISAEANMMS